MRPARRDPFTPRERLLVDRLRTPVAVQRWLNGLPYNWERRGPTARTFRQVVRRGEAHCLEAALSAATILAEHGYPPLLVDIESVDRLDHVVFVYQDRGTGLWGSIGRSRCLGLHGRKPVFRDLDALVKTYMAPFVDTTGRVKGWGLLDLRTLRGIPWRLGSRNVWAVEDRLNAHRHHRLPTSDTMYRLWKRRFDRWWQTNGKPDHAWPAHYDQSTWSQLPVV